ncbi:Na(+)/H(+) antiporter subunit C [Blastococcus sp. Marseille-P5729]|uniref:Na(+)/H(+) antiporter subunit C n=1 Tax=Blastococcus sp. Marseille-P5729 TaxID=2086582 RepID=UPI0018FE12C4|nr:Na(+)/H(+) antiporter subunit C [Blastococcus sp. Marseille-P5729]
MSILAAGQAGISPNVTLIVVASVLVGCGVYLLLERALTRVLLGIVLMSNGVSLLYMVVSGRARGAPLIGERPADEMSDALPQAFVLTAIVISLATVAFMMALAYRQWQLTGSDDVPDDAEDALIQRMAERDEVSETYDAEDTTSTTSAEEDPDEADLSEEAAAEAQGAERTDLAVHEVTAPHEGTVVDELSPDGEPSPGDEGGKR